MASCNGVMADDPGQAVGGGVSSTGGNVAGSGGGNDPYGGTAGRNTGGTHTAAGGVSTTECWLDAGVVTGNICTVRPGILGLDASCAFGTSNMVDSSWSGSFACWSGVTAVCSGTDMRVTGTYPGYAVTNTNGNAGCNTQFNVASDAGPGCAILNASAHKGITFDLTVIALPDNILIVGVQLANSNQMETTLTNLTMGANHVELSWANFPPMSNCGPKDGSNITNLYLVFKWFADSGNYAVDATFSNLGFYD